MVVCLITGSSPTETISSETTSSPTTKKSPNSFRHSDDVIKLQEINQKMKNKIGLLYSDSDIAEAIEKKLGKDVFKEVFQPQVKEMNTLLFNNEAALEMLKGKSGDRMVKSMCKISKRVRQFEKKLKKFTTSPEMKLLLEGDTKNVAEITDELEKDCAEYKKALNFMVW